MCSSGSECVILLTDTNSALKRLLPLIEKSVSYSLVLMFWRYSNTRMFSFWSLDSFGVVLWDEFLLLVFIISIIELWKLQHARMCMENVHIRKVCILYGCWGNFSFHLLNDLNSCKSFSLFLHSHCCQLTLVYLIISNHAGNEMKPPLRLSLNLPLFRSDHRQFQTL